MPKGKPSDRRVKADPILASLRHISGNRRTIHCFKIDVLDEQIAVHFHQPTNGKMVRCLTEWFPRNEWSMGDKVPYVGVRLITPEEKEKALDAELEIRLQKSLRRKEQWNRQARKARARKKAEASGVRILLDEPTATPTPEAKPPDPDSLTPDEEAALGGGPKPSIAGNLNSELPGEYNAQLHMRTDKHPWGDPEKLAVFDALVQQEATSQEAKRRIEMMRARRAGRALPERDGATWGPE